MCCLSTSGMKLFQQPCQQSIAFSRQYVLVHCLFGVSHHLVCILNGFGLGLFSLPFIQFTIHFRVCDTMQHSSVANQGWFRITLLLVVHCWLASGLIHGSCSFKLWHHYVRWTAFSFISARCWNLQHQLAHAGAGQMNLWWFSPTLYSATFQVRG